MEKFYLIDCFLGISIGMIKTDAREGCPGGSVN